ncbi:hypothetical protein [Wolbachia endosymbiont (group A) of Oxytorus armatus]
MSDYSEQKNVSNFKIMDKIEVKHRPSSFEKQKENNAQVSYVHKIFDKLVKDLNDGFVPNLDDVLHSNKESLGALNVNLETEKGKLGNLIEEVGNNNKDLIKKLNDLQEEIKQLKSEKSGGEDIDIDQDEWTAPTHPDIL